MTTLESFTHWLAAALGHGFDPDGGDLPEWPETKKPTAPLKSNGREIPLDKRVFKLSGSEGGFGFLSHPVPGANGKKAGEVAVLTERENGEAVQYAKTQKLKNEELLALVKRLKLEGKSAAEIAQVTGYSVSYIEKHSAALSRADD